VRSAKGPRLWLGLSLRNLFLVLACGSIAYPLSVAYPFVGLSYVLVVVMSRFVLHEQIPASRWLGVLIVTAGIVIIGLSFRVARDMWRLSVEPRPRTKHRSGPFREGPIATGAINGDRPGLCRPSGKLDST
jgi:hypothetical protein